jgi:hypothetical protein
MADNIDIHGTISLEDKASGALHSVQHAAQGAGHSAHGLGERLAHVKEHSLALAASVVGVGFGLHEMAHLALHANKQLDDMQDHITGAYFAMLKWPEGATAMQKWSASGKQANETIELIEQTAYDFAQSAPELEQSWKSMAAGMLTASGSTEELNRAFVAAAGAAAALGTSTAGAGQQMQMMVRTGTVMRGGGEFGSWMRGVIGNVKEFKHLSEHARFEKLTNAMEKLKPAGTAAARGFDESIKRIQMSVEEGLRDLTKPLFEHLGLKLEAWGKKIRELQKSGQLHEWAEKLAGAFQKMEKAGGFLVDHWKGIAAVVAGSKIMSVLDSLKSMSSGVVGGALGALTGFKGGLEKAGGAGDLLGTLGKFSGGLLVAIPAIVGLTEALSSAAVEIADWFGKKVGMRGANIDLLSSTPMEGMFKRAGQILSGEKLRAKGNARDEGALDAGILEQRRIAEGLLRGTGMLEGKGFSPAFNDAMLALDEKVVARYAKLLGLDPLHATAGTVSGVFQEIMYKGLHDPPHARKDATAPEIKGAVPPAPLLTGDIHIHMDFKDADPDRVMLEFKAGLETIVDRAHQSSRTFHHG